MYSNNSYPFFVHVTSKWREILDAILSAYIKKKCFWQLSNKNLFKFEVIRCALLLHMLAASIKRCFNKVPFVNSSSTAELIIIIRDRDGVWVTLSRVMWLLSKPFRSIMPANIERLSWKMYVNVLIQYSLSEKDLLSRNLFPNIFLTDFSVVGLSQTW